MQPLVGVGQANDPAHTDEHEPQTNHQEGDGDDVSEHGHLDPRSVFRRLIVNLESA